MLVMWKFLISLFRHHISFNIGKSKSKRYVLAFLKTKYKGHISSSVCCTAIN